MDELFWKSLRTFLKPIASLWEGHQASRLFINSPDDVWIEQNGRLEQTSVQLSQEQLLHTVRNLAQLSGVLLNEETPFFSQCFEDGTQITVLLPPWVENGPVVVLEREDSAYFHLAQMVQSDFLSEPAALFLKASLQSRRPMWLVGSNATGKSTLLRALAEHLPAAERTLLFAERSPVEIHHPHLIQIRKDLIQSEHQSPSISLSDTITKLRPQRLLIEDLDAKTVQHLGLFSLPSFSGSLLTFSAADSAHALSVFEALWSPLFLGASPYTQRLQVAAAVSLILTCRRTTEHQVQLYSIDEVITVDLQGHYQIRPLFRRFWNNEEAAVREILLPTGILPSFWTFLSSFHSDLSDPAFYHPGNYTGTYLRKPASRLQAIDQQPPRPPYPRLKDWLLYLEHFSSTPLVDKSDKVGYSTSKTSALLGPAELEPLGGPDLRGNKQATDLFAVLGSVLSALSSENGASNTKKPVEAPKEQQAENPQPSLEHHPSNDATLTPQNKSAPLATSRTYEPQEYLAKDIAQFSPSSAFLSSSPSIAHSSSAHPKKSSSSPLSSDAIVVKPPPETQQSLPQTYEVPLHDNKSVVEPALYDVSFDEDQIESTHLTQLSDAGYTNLAPLREPPAWPQTQTTHPSAQREISPPPSTTKSCTAGSLGDPCLRASSQYKRTCGRRPTRRTQRTSFSTRPTPPQRKHASYRSPSRKSLCSDASKCSTRTLFNSCLRLTIPSITRRSSLHNSSSFRLPLRRVWAF